MLNRYNKVDVFVGRFIDCLTGLALVEGHLEETPLLSRWGLLRRFIHC
jgi:hypothetical protein